MGVDKGLRTEQPHNPLPCPLLAQAQFAALGNENDRGYRLPLDASSAPAMLSFLFPPSQSSSSWLPDGGLGEGPEPWQPRLQSRDFQLTLGRASGLHSPAAREGGLPEGRFSSPPPRGSRFINFQIPKWSLPGCEGVGQ